MNKYLLLFDEFITKEEIENLNLALKIFMVDHKNAEIFAVESDKYDSKVLKNYNIKFIKNEEVYGLISDKYFSKILNFIYNAEYEINLNDFNKLNVIFLKGYETNVLINVISKSYNEQLFDYYCSENRLNNQDIIFKNQSSNLTLDHTLILNGDISETRMFLNSLNFFNSLEKQRKEIREKDTSFFNFFNRGAFKKIDSLPPYFFLKYYQFIIDSDMVEYRYYFNIKKTEEFLECLKNNII